MEHQENQASGEPRDGLVFPRRYFGPRLAGGMICRSGSGAGSVSGDGHEYFHGFVRVRGLLRSREYIKLLMDDTGLR
jgi:hypothetical protein